MPSIAAILNHLKRHVVLYLVALFLVIIVGGYAAGYRPGPGLTFVRVGTLTVTDLPAGSTVYADQTPRGTVKAAGSLSASLVPGSHAVIVDAPNEEPWEKIVTISSDTVTSVSPILVPKKPAPKQLPEADRKNAAAAFALTTLPQESAPLHLGCADVFVSTNRIIAQAATSTGCAAPDYMCTEDSCAPTIVFSPVAAIHSVIPFPARTDALIIAAGDSVYAIALDPRSPQYFAPVAHGVAPSVAAASSTAFYISDAGHFFSVSF